MTAGHTPNLGPLSRADELDQQFIEFDQQNPRIYQEFRRLAVSAKRKGHERWGAKSLWEVLRWELAVNSNAPVSDYKLNNNYTSRYARKLMAEDKEEWGDFFQLRRLKGGAQ